VEQGNNVRAQGAADDLAAALRSATVRVAEAAGGGLALLFGGENGSTALKLRSAAGFADPQEARAAADEVFSRAQAAAFDGRQAEVQPAAMGLGPRGAGGLAVIPLAVGERRHGVLVAAAPTAIDAAMLANLVQAAAGAAYRLDHEVLLAEVERLREASGGAQPGEDRSDEILRLSEQLFAQDLQLLQNNEKLGKIEKLKNDFIEKMSRELRTPLNSIIEAIISVLAGENEALSDNAKQSLRNALDEGTAFLRTLQNILDLWRIKQGELPVEIQDVNFREVVDEAIFSVQDTLGDKPVTIQKEYEEPLPKLRTDLAKINQVLFLLLDNAVKFTEQGTIRIHAAVRDGNLTCTLEDTGIGLCPDDQQLIWDEFYQVDELSSTKYQGSGLGLALVRDLLVLLDGSVAVTSEVGKGTTVTFQVPVQVVG
jgi:signal transduction histidine kinase